MPEMMRLIVSRLREFVGNRRRATRFEVRLPCKVSLVTSKRGANGSRRPAKLEGHTKDVSESGLGLITPAIRIGDHYLTGMGSTLQVELDLPNGIQVSMQAVAVRYERLEEDETSISYVIGAEITEISEDDAARFAAYLKLCKTH